MPVPDATQFQTDFPEFKAITGVAPADLTNMITFWLAQAVLFVRQDRWGAQYNLGLELFTAHNVALEAFDVRGAAAGAVPGLNPTLLTSKAAGDVSASYDISAGLELDAGHWNLSRYGMRFIRIARMMGAGPMYFGAGCSTGTGGWPGPIY